MMVVMTTRVRVRVQTDGTQRQTTPVSRPFGHRPRHRSSCCGGREAVCDRQTENGWCAKFYYYYHNFFFHRPILTLWPYRTVYYTKTATANCESDYDSRSSAAVVEAAAEATVENNIILLMNRNPIACRQSLCISCN